jgi:hypothetical protein
MAKASRKGLPARERALTSGVNVDFWPLEARLLRELALQAKEPNLESFLRRIALDGLRVNIPLAQGAGSGKTLVSFGLVTRALLEAFSKRP